MKLKLSASVIAIAAVLGTAALADNGTSTFDAAVSVLSPDQTGFIIGGQVAVTGLGSGALTLSRSAAQMDVTGGAKSGLNFDKNSYLSGVGAGSYISSALVFDREISTSGSLVGQGSVTSRGEAIASMGTAGAASAETSTAGTRDDITAGNTVLVAGGEGSATASSSTQGSLNGSVSTANTLQMLGTSGLFAGSNALTVGENNKAIGGGSAVVLSDDVGIDLTGAAIDYGTDNELPTTDGDDGAVFGVLSTLSGNTIDMSVSNAGNGTISLTTSTGGFFTGGGAAAGSTTQVDSGSFFSPDLPI